MWNRNLAARLCRRQADRKGRSYAESGRALTAMKKDAGLAFLDEASFVQLTRPLRH